MKTEMSVDNRENCMTITTNYFHLNFNFKYNILKNNMVKCMKTDMC